MKIYDECAREQHDILFVLNNEFGKIHESSKVKITKEDIKLAKKECRKDQKKIWKFLND